MNDAFSYAGGKRFANKVFAPRLFGANKAKRRLQELLLLKWSDKRENAERLLK